MSEKSMSMDLRIKLSAMMFLQFMMFAVWWVPLAAYMKKLGMSGTQMGWIFSSMALGCMAAPIVGMIADRHFASEKVLCVLNVLTAGLLFLSAGQTTATPLFVLLLLAMLCYMPTWGLTSAIAMANSPAEKFPQIRVFGSIGWVASAIFSLVAVNVFKVEGFETSKIPMLCGAAVSLLCAGLALTIPTTPPPAKGQKASIVDALGLRALSLMKDLNFAVFIIISCLVMIPFVTYFNFGSSFFDSLGYKTITARMNLGQFGEIFFMLLIPMAIARIGVKWSMCVGLVVLVIRYGAFLLGVTMDMPVMYYIAIIVHGLIFGFFFVGGQIYIDKKAPEEMRAQAQGFIFFSTFGVGMVLGNFVNGKLLEGATVEGVVNWQSIWMIVTIMSAVLLGAYLLFFHDHIGKEEQAQAEPGPDAEAASA